MPSTTRQLRQPPTIEAIGRVPYFADICTKSGSYVKVSLFILNRFPLLTLSFNSLGLSGDNLLIFLTTISPRLCLNLALILNV